MKGFSFFWLRLQFRNYKIECGEENEGTWLLGSITLETEVEMLPVDSEINCNGTERMKKKICNGLYRKWIQSTRNEYKDC